MVSPVADLNNFKFFCDKLDVVRVKAIYDKK